MTFRAGQPRTLNMDRMREPDILRLLRIHQPRSLVPGLDVVIYQSGLGRGLADPLRVTPGTLLRGRNPGKVASSAKFWHSLHSAMPDFSACVLWRKSSG